MTTLLRSHNVQKNEIDLRNLIIMNNVESEDDEFDYDFDYDPNEMYYALVADKK